MSAVVASKIDAALGSIGALSKEAEQAARSVRTASGDWRDWAAAVGALDPQQFVSQDQALAGLNDQLKSYQSQAKAAADQMSYLQDKSKFTDVSWSGIDEGLAHIYSFTKGLAESKARMAEFQIAQYGIQQAASNGTLSLADQARKLEALKAQYSNLDQASLGQLQQQIDQVNASLQSMENNAAQTLASLNAQLAQAQGKLAEQATIDGQQKVLRLQQQINEAKAAGDSKALADLQQALSVQQQLNDLAVQKARVQEEQAKAQAAQAKQAITSANQPNQQSTSPPTQPVKVVHLTLGNGLGFDVPANQESQALSVIRQLTSDKRVAS